MWKGNKFIVDGVKDFEKNLKLFIVVWIFYWMFKKNEWNNIVIM